MGYLTQKHRRQCGHHTPRDVADHKECVRRFGLHDAERDGYIGYSGFTLMEVAIAAAIVATLLAVVGQMTVLVRVARRAAEHQVSAQETADNLLEHVANLPWHTITPGAEFADMLAADFVASLPVSDWDVAVTTEDAPLPAKRITVTVYRNGGGDAVGPVRLTAWVYPPREDIP